MLVVYANILPTGASMFDKLKKAPLIEISIILLLNIVMIIVGLVCQFLTFMSLEIGIQPDEKYLLIRDAICYFIITGCYIGVYLDLFTLSINRTFLKIIYYFKTHKIILTMLLLILLLLSPSFLLACLHFSFYVFIPGCYLSNAFPLIVLSLYSILQERISQLTSRGGKILDVTGRMIISLLILLFLGGVFRLVPEMAIENIDLKWINIGILLLTVPVLITEETKGLINWAKQKILYVIPASALLYYIVICLIKSEWLAYYTNYLLLLFYWSIILSDPVLALKTKNRAIMEEIELEDKTVQCLLKEAQEQNNV